MRHVRTWRLHSLPQAAKLTDKVQIRLISRGVISHQLLLAVVVVTFFNKTLSTAKLQQFWRLKIYERKYNIRPNDVHT